MRKFALTALLGLVLSASADAGLIFNRHRNRGWSEACCQPVQECGPCGQQVAECGGCSGCGQQMQAVQPAPQPGGRWQWVPDQVPPTVPMLKLRD